MQPTEMEEYLFDLRGYIVLKNAVDAEHLVGDSMRLSIRMTISNPMDGGGGFIGAGAHDICTIFLRWVNLLNA